MSWYGLTILTDNRVFEGRITAIKKDRAMFQSCDEDGNILEEEIPKNINHERTALLQQYKYKLINGKAKAKLKRTKVINSLKLVDLNEVTTMIIESYFYLDNEDLRQYLLEKGKAIYTHFTAGNGFKVYEAYITPYKNWLIMICGFGRLDEVILDKIADRIPSHEMKKILDTQVERVSEAELFEAVEIKTPITYTKDTKTKDKKKKPLKEVNYLAELREDE